MTQQVHGNMPHRLPPTGHQLRANIRPNATGLWGIYSGEDSGAAPFVGAHSTLGQGPSPHGDVLIRGFYSNVRNGNMNGDSGQEAQDTRVQTRVQGTTEYDERRAERVRILRQAFKRLRNGFLPPLLRHP
jgi:hypothetical protein